MGQPAAKQGDQIKAMDIHIVMVPSPNGEVATPLPHNFNGILNSNLSTNVKIEGKPAATVGSVADNTPPHIPAATGRFQTPPTNKGQIMMGSATVFINNKPAARSGDTAQTCNDPSPLPIGKVVASSTVMIG